MRCVGPTEARQILEEMHEGHAGNHSGGRSLAFRTYRVGFYWPTMKTDAAELVQRCDKCQRFAPVSQLHVVPLNSITSPWPFDK